MRLKGESNSGADGASTSRFDLREPGKIPGYDASP